VEQGPSQPSFLARHEFLIRRLHSLSGLIPVGAYMVIHIVTNASVLNGAATYQNAVYQIHGLGKILPVVEWVFIFIPILFHAIIGVLIIREGLPNTTSYPYLSNVRYTLQRASGIVAFVFIMWHVFHMHGWFHADWWIDHVARPLGGWKFRPFNAGSTGAAAMQQSLIIVVLYVIGVLSCVFHLANGLWTMGITWGIWTTPRAQKRADVVCAALGVLLAAVALGAIGGFATLDVEGARTVEDKMRHAREAEGLIEPDEHKIWPEPEESVSQGIDP
jgi:succinate dehydrogenase / fumarate reductase cytochrome b subunit